MLSEAKHLAPEGEARTGMNETPFALPRSFPDAQDDRNSESVRVAHPAEIPGKADAYSAAETVIGV